MQQNQNQQWPGSSSVQNNKKRAKIFYLVLAIVLVIASAFGSFYFSQNLNQASVPNAPESQPQAAAGKNQKTNNTEAEGCAKGCGSNEYCDNGRCRAIGGKADGRSDAEKAWDSVVIATPTPKGEATTTKGYETIPGYRCTAQNCNSGFRCLNENTCINIANPNLSVANDPENCGGTGNRCPTNHTCVMGGCVSKTSLQSGCPSTCVSPYKCEKSTSDNLYHCIYSDISIAKVTPYIINTTLTKQNDPDNCGGPDIKCADGVQKCENGKCVYNKIPGTELCGNLLPDQTYENGINTAYSKTCCVPAGTGIGVIPTEAFNNKTNPVPEGLKTGDLDTRAHWTNCAPGTTCRQGVGCIGTATKTPETTTTTTTIVTTTTTPSITTTTTPSITTTITPTDTITITPTPVSCNETCSTDSDCVSGLYCDPTAKKCRKSECSTETSCVCPTATPTKEPTIVGCNKGCVSDNNCMEGLVCDSDSGRCRRPSCMSSSDCRCEREVTATRRPTERETITTTRRPVARQEERLVEAGILDLPGAITFGGGLILAIVGILLAL